MAYPVPNIIGSGATWAQLQSSGASGLLELLITAQVATVAPTAAPTLASSGSAGTLAATTYYVVCTETNGVGETTASPVSTGLPITSTLSIVVTFPTLKTGNTARNTYVGTAVGGPWLLAASGTTTATVTISSLATNSYAIQPPTINTTGLTYTDANSNVVDAALSFLRSAKDGNLEDVYRSLRQTIDEFLRGEPMPFNAAIAKLRHAHTCFAGLAKLCSDIGTLVDANAGTLGTTATGIGGRRANRTWP